MDIDLTEHRKMEAAVRAGEALRSSIYDSVTDIIFYLKYEGDERYRFESVNRAFLAATGLRDDEVVGRLVDEIIPQPSLALVKAKYAEALATRRRVSWEEVSKYPSGTKYGDVAVTPIYDPTGRCTHLVGTVHDITERRTAEQERRQIDEQLHQAQRLQALGTLAGGIAHDFNNILAAVHGNLDLALPQVDPRHPAYECLSDLKQAAERGTSLVRQILTFGRESESRRELVDLCAVAEEALDLSRVTLNPKTALELSFASDTPRILGDSTQVHRAIVNLISNAAQAIGDAPGRIEVRGERCEIAPGARSDAPEAEGAYAKVTVRDDGPGIPADTLRRVFEPFFTTKPLGRGTGLGLSVVHGVMKAHKGVVTVQSEVGRGTTFELLFPAAPAQSGATPGAANGGRRILFVDDDEALVVLVRRAFSRLGHRVSAFSKPLDALDAFRKSPDDFDVVVIDHDMPELDGPALIRQLRQVRPSFPVILTAESLRPDHAAIAEKLGLTRLLERPASPNDLAKLVELQIIAPAT
jgi:PAS domain S-box-containing protein